jgi:molybdopterin molybdotransferase
VSDGGLVPLDDARRLVVGGCLSLPPVRWPLAVADGCVVAEQVRAADPVPGFDNSAMDGYAVDAADLADATAADPVTLTVGGEALAGRALDVADGSPEGASPVGGRRCVRIMTGAPLPPGADAVVPVERTSTGSWSSAGAVETTVTFHEAVPVGDNVRRAGEDLAAGDVVCTPGTTLTPPLLGLVAAAGRGSVLVHPRPRVGVFTTGDELVEAPWPLAPGQVRDTNRIVLLARLARDGFTPVDLGHLPDDPEAIAAAVRAGVATCDALLTTGGVSMGQVDLVRVVLDELGELAWLKVAIKPAKPFAFGRVSVGRGEQRREVPVFGLPGNPVSSLVSYELLARPGLRRIAGHGDDDLVRPTRPATVVGALPRRPDGKVHFARVCIDQRPDGGLTVRSAGGQGSHQLAALAAADGLAVLPDGDGAVEGDDVEVIVWG